MALEKSNIELNKYKEKQKEVEYNQSLEEIEKDIKNLSGNKRKEQ